MGAKNFKFQKGLEEGDLSLDDLDASGRRYGCWIDKKKKKSANLQSNLVKFNGPESETTDCALFPEKRYREENIARGALG